MVCSEGCIRDSHIWSCLIFVREIIERCVAPCGIRCDVTSGDSLWDRVLVHQLVMVRTLSGGGPGIWLRGSEICSRSVRHLDIETCDVDSCDQRYWCLK